MTTLKHKNLIKMGMMIGNAKIPINIDDANSMEEFSEQLNIVLNTNIAAGMKWESLFAELEKGIANYKFDDSMQVL